MNQIFIRPFRAGDLDKMVGWMKANPTWDANILKYPGTVILVAFNNTGTLGFLPVQKTMTMESMCFHPLTTDSQKALTMKELTHALITQSYVQGVGEIYFAGSNPETNDFAVRQGFQQLGWPMYRVRLVDLEAGGGGNGPVT